MQFKENPRKIGYIKKSHGVQGGLILNLDHAWEDDPEYPEWAFLEIDQSLVPYKLLEDDCFLKDNKSMVLFFKDCPNLTESVGLIGRIVFFPEACLPQQSKKSFKLEQYVGFEIQLQVGILGIIEEFVEIPGNPLFRIMLDSSEVLVPAREEWIISLDKGEKKITMEIPEGLIEANSGSSS